MAKTGNRIEKIIENVMYASRWLLAPIYLGLSLMVLATGIKFYQELFHAVPLIIKTKDIDMVLVALSLIDLSLIGGLIVMVMLSGYENFVSRIDIGEKGERLSWLGKLDAGSLKLKIASTIVAISSIYLLKAFMNADQISDNKLMWYVIMHLTFVLSAVGIGTIDKMSKK
ncbi:MAG: TIGR00645 family protein [Candidatus Brocadiaceae bacterium]|nr:TIGR00645 family protein [Candidatus Brocadiaceae bacterium]